MNKRLSAHAALSVGYDANLTFFFALAHLPTFLWLLLKISFSKLDYLHKLQLILFVINKIAHFSASNLGRRLALRSTPGLQGISGFKWNKSENHCSVRRIGYAI